MRVSKTPEEGSIPSTPAKKKTALLLIFKTSLKSIAFSLVFFFYATTRKSHCVGDFVATLVVLIYIQKELSKLLPTLNNLSNNFIFNLKSVDFLIELYIILT